MLCVLLLFRNIFFCESKVNLLKRVKNYSEFNIEQRNKNLKIFLQFKKKSKYVASSSFQKK